MKKTTVYTVRMSADLNEDYIAVCATLEDVADEISELLKEEDGYELEEIEKVELVANMKKREKAGYADLFDDDNIAEVVEVTVNAVKVRQRN